MRNNQPVTGHEIPMKDGSLIVSRTDINGKMEYVSDDFIEISGFSRDELIGEPHNIIRHPDMPKEAFADMWHDLKAGLSWTGYVKNRIKNGNHYWVQANVTPIIEGGQTKGYISIRRKPDQTIPPVIDKIYAEFQNGTAKNKVISHGAVVDMSTRARLSRYTKKLEAKVFGMGAVLCVMILIVSGVGIYINGQTTESLRTVYEDRVIPAGQLSDIKKKLYDTILNLNLIVNNSGDREEFQKEIEGNILEVKEIWTAYMATYLTPEEKILADQYSTEQEKYINEILTPALTMIKESKNEDLQKFIPQAHALFDEAQSTNDKLIALQIDVSKAEHEKSEIQGTIGHWITFISVVISIAVAVFTSKYVQKFLQQRLAYLDSRLSSIAGGNTNTDIDVGVDEMQNILTTVRTLQAKLAYGELEKKENERAKKIAQEDMAKLFENRVGGIVENVERAADAMRQMAASLAAAVQETTQQSSTVAAASLEASANVQTVAAASEELSASIKEIARNVSDTAQTAKECAQSAKMSQEVLQALQQAVGEIDSVIQSISGVAEQTNLLALNATIEAARAGDAGKGFAVVANEVKSLADETRKMTVEIAQKVETIKESAEKTISGVSQILRQINDVDERAGSIAGAIEEQNAATVEISRNVQEAAHGTDEVSRNIEQVQQAANDSAAATEQLRGAADDLAVQASNLKESVVSFLAEIRAA